MYRIGQHNVKIRPKQRSREELDASKATRVSAHLNKLSQKTRLAELQQASTPPKSRSAVSPKVTVKMNISGTRPEAAPSVDVKRKRAMRKFYSKAMPVLQCSGCAFASSCPKYRNGYECAFLPLLNSHEIESEGDLLDAMKTMAAGNMRRAHLATLMETLSGGAPSLETSEALNMTFMQLKALHETMTQTQGEVTIESGDASIIGRLFGDVGSLIKHTRKAVDNPIDVSPAPLPEADRPKELTEGESAEIDLDLVREHSVDELVHLSGKGREEVSGAVKVSEARI